jgi:hypothetical protein
MVDGHTPSGTPACGLYCSLDELDGEQDTSGTQKSPYPRGCNQDFFIYSHSMVLGGLEEMS